MYDDERSMSRQRDLVLANNEFCFVQSQTNGTIRVHVGPTTVSISQQESLVIFNEKTKQFEKVEQHDRAKQLFVTAPEGWYITLKNPTTDGQFPVVADSNNSPASMKVGVKINIAGPASFALFPGQMARVIQGHKLRSNQYLLARVYDADAVQNGKDKDINPLDLDKTDDKKQNPKFITGQLVVIKGTEVSFYMPPTGIEVVPNEDGSYIREAVTLERLNYAILKNEDGEKRYVHGPAVVFPKPTETFVKNADGSPIFKAIELSPICGVYVKVIAPYEEDGIKHELGEELFITGNDGGQKIYYPRPEHTIISYGSEIVHYAIAIPTGEGRYVLNRQTGEIETVKGPQMFLPDPRTQVIVRRILTNTECNLLYPGNNVVVEYNHQLQEGSDATNPNRATTSATRESRSQYVALADIQRRTTFTKPRTITLDTKFDGVVSVDIWTGYAINVVSKTGQRQVVVGPTTRLLDYDETVESLQLSTGKPKTTDQLETVAFLRIANNKVSDIINAQTKDFVNVSIKVSYIVDFLSEYKEKWFSVENYVKFLCDHERTTIKKAVSTYTIQELYANAIEVVTAAVLDTSSPNDEASPDGNATRGHLFVENGMYVKEVEVLSLNMDPAIERIIDAQQVSMVRDSLTLADKESHLALQKRLSEAERQEEAIKTETQRAILELQSKYRLREVELERKQAAMEAEAELEAAQAREKLQDTLDAIHRAELARDNAAYLQDVEHRNADAKTEKMRQQNYASAIETILTAIQPDLVAALTATANAELLASATQSMAPWAIAQDESVPDTINKLLRGTTLEHVLEDIRVTQGPQE